MKFSLESFESKREIDTPLEIIEDLDNIKFKERNFTKAFARFTIALEHCNSLLDYRLLYKDMEIYKKNSLLSFTELHLLDELMQKCSKYVYKEKELNTTISKPLDYINEISEIDETGLLQPVSSEEDNNNSKDNANDIIQNLLNLIDKEYKDSKVEIVPTKQPVKVHVIKARKKKVPKKAKVRIIAKNGLPFNHLENDTNLTKRR